MPLAFCFVEYPTAASILAMKRAVVQLMSSTHQQPSIILVDAMPVSLSHSDIPVVHFCYGESKSSSIAAASIIAKVTRDALMTRMDQVIPGYLFSNNKGYGTKAHRQAIGAGGVSLLHRMRFIHEKADNGELEEMGLLFEEQAP